ncbi:TPR-like protein [Mycena galericulata]|nr:TPR-like protein [Mycena galericulata]
MSSQDRAQTLKLQGNAFHEKGEYQAAYDKYTEAIKEDPDNAVLYANRSASSLSMKEYLDAASDAEAATKRDPTYAKAWARMANAAQGLGAWDKCFGAWESALACIPSQDLTTGQKKLQAQFREGLKASKTAKANPPPPSRIVALPVGRKGKASSMDRMPWARAAALEKKIIATQEDSSAIIILYASRTYEHGLKSMKGTVKRYIKGELVIDGVPNAIQGMTNGILIDRRCFYMERNWLEEYLEQVKFEGEYYQAWGSQSAKVVCEQAPGRLQKEGWSSVGPALCMTIRLWIMQGFLGGSNGNQCLAAQLFGNALEVIDWGRETWKDVPRADRGDIFDITFRRSVNRLFIAAVMDWLEMDDPECKYTLQDLAKFARNMIEELEENTEDKIKEAQYHPKHSGSWTYPHADTLGALGWFHMRLAKKAQTKEDKKIHLAAAARYYMKSAETYPPDDEFAPFFMSIALDAFREHGTPLRHTLPICKRIRKAIPSMLKIWESSAMSKRRDVGLQEVLDWERECQKGLLTGRYTLATEVDRIA